MTIAAISSNNFDIQAVNKNQAKGNSSSPRKADVLGSSDSIHLSAKDTKSDVGTYSYLRLLSAFEKTLAKAAPQLQEPAKTLNAGNWWTPPPAEKAEPSGGDFQICEAPTEATEDSVNRSTDDGWWNPETKQPQETPAGGDWQTTSSNNGWWNPETKQPQETPAEGDWQTCSNTFEQ